MIKRILSLFLACLLLVSVLLVPTLAADLDPIEVIYFEDGSCIKVYLIEFDTRANGNKSGSKTYVFENASGVEEWRATLYGSFSYYNGTATCTSASCDVSISKSTWSVGSKSVYKYDNVAQVDLRMVLSVAGVTSNTYRTLYLECDADGNLS